LLEVRALTFDVFGTLLDWRSAICDAFLETGLDGDPGELADDWRARLWPITGEVNEGRRSWANFDELHHATLGDLLAERGLELSSQARSELVQAWHRLGPWPDVRAGLQALRTDRVVAALSNGHIALLVDLARYADLRFDCLLSAEFPRVYKPQAEVYLAGARLLGLEPGQVMMVAAHPFDLEGARRAGLRSAFVDRPLEYGPGSPPREDPDADVAVADLDELAAWLERTSAIA
jgi:2-haloacid dehalogenase